MISTSPVIIGPEYLLRMRNDLSFLSLEIGGEKIEESLKKNRSTENEKKNKHYNNLHKPYTPRVSSEVQ